jgi:tetratricopeptide (TPR) repeat protein
LEYVESRMVQSGLRGSRQTCLLRGILGLLALLVLVGVASGAAYLYLNLTGSGGGSSPVDQLRPDKIDPAIALATLAGISDLDVLNQSLAQGDLETAYATVLFNTQLTHREHVGNLLLLGQEYAKAGDSSHAQLCYRQASLISVLSPTLSDYGRATSLLEIGGGFADQGNREEALFSYDQAFVLASHSPFMKDPYRAEVLGQLATGYSALGERDRSEECSSLKVEILYSTDGQATSSAGSPEQPVVNFLYQIPAPTTEMVASYEDRRVEAVQELMASLQGGSDKGAVSQELLTKVTQALVNEDNARRTALEDQMGAATSMVLRIGIAEARVDWLLIKYRVALGAFGLDLVPAWSEDVAGIAAELGTARGELHAIYGEQIDTFADEMAKDRAWFDVVRLEILQGQLGLYPEYPEEELISQLSEVSARLAEAGDQSVRPEVSYEDTTPVFKLAWAE